MSERTAAERWSIFLGGDAQAWRQQPGHELVRAVHVLLVIKDVLHANQAPPPL